MKQSILFTAILLALAPQFAVGEITLDLSTAKLTLDELGCVQSLTFADGTRWPAIRQPAFRLQTAEGIQEPQAVRLDNGRLEVTFVDGSVAEFTVKPEPGFALFRLNKLTSKADAESLHLFCLPVPPEAKIAGTLNGAFAGPHAAAVMAAEVNVQTFTAHEGSRADREGCSHEFVQANDDVKAGRHAARFTATCNEKGGGWSVQGTRPPRPLDLTGCKAIRAWVHGDGQGESLKIQLTDGADGYRDDYRTIDFQGWQQVTLATPALNTLRYNRVGSLNFYYNGLPAGRTVTCVLDQIEAILERNGKEQVVLLEDFESPGSPLWTDAVATLNARTQKAHGIEPAAFGLVACPRSEFFAAVQRFEKAAGVPSPQLGGVWNKQSPWIKRSYFFLTDFREKDFDAALAIAQRGGFDLVIIDQDSWCKGTGHYEINRDRFPDGLDGLKRTLDRFKQAGFKVGLHVLGASIYPPDTYITPVPDPRLVKDEFATLAADVDEKSDFIPTAKAPAAFPAEDKGYMGKGMVLQIGDELITYSDRSMEPPYGFRGCRRGHLGTKPAAHAKGQQVAHLLRSYGYHMYDMDTTILDEVATNFARVANACDIQMIYFDGSEALQGDHSYYNARLHKAFYDKLANKNILLQASSFSPYSWHLLARSASADGHGDLKGYLDERSPGFNYLALNGMPLDIGWYYGYDPMSTPDQYEYILGATIGYDSSMSFQVSPGAAKAHPFTGNILDLIRRYEQLRLSGRVPAEMRKRLQIDPVLGGEKKPEDRDKLLAQRREYRLLDTDRGQVFQRVFHEPWHELTATDGPESTWPVEVRQGPARVGIQIQALPGPWTAAGPSYDSPDAIVLETFDDLAPYSGNPKQKNLLAIGPGESGAVLPGVTQRLESTDQDARAGRRCAVYTAESALGQVGGWSAIGKAFDASLDLSHHKGIGFWLRGDGQGSAFKVQLCDDKSALDYYVTNNFTGWQYQQFAWPEDCPIDLSKVRRLTLYYNGLPGKTTVACGIDDIKALPALDVRTVTDPWVEVGGKRFQWQGTLAQGQYLFFWPGESLTRYGLPLSEPEKLPLPSDVWELPAGTHEARFGCSGPLYMPVRVRVSLQPAEQYVIP